MSAIDWVKSRLKVVNESGKEIIAQCPTCGRSTLWINPDKGVCICYRDCFSGGLAHLVMVVEGCSFREAKKLLEEEGAFSIDDLRNRFDKLRPIHEHVSVIQDLPAGFQPCFDGRRYHIPEYLDEREFDDDTLRQHGIGFALEGRYFNRVIIPIHCVGNKTFQARIMGKPSNFTWRDKMTGKIREPSKYLSPKGAKIGNHLYWYDNTPQRKHLIAVEGMFDAIRLISFGFYSIANFGKRMTNKQISLLSKLKPKSITFLYDDGAISDAHADAWRTKQRLRYMPISVAELNVGEDPDSLGLKGGRKAINTALDKSQPVTNQLASLRASLAAITG